MQILDLFCGGGGASLGFKLAGHNVFGIDADPDAIALYRRNVGEAICADITRLNPKDFQGFDGLFASPPCQQWSTARSLTLPVRDDAEVGMEVVRWLETLQPRIFLMENVIGYRKSASYQAILSCLSQMGYLFDAALINMAKFAVPQTRSRLIVRAYLNRFIPALSPSARRGWDEVLADRLDSLASTKLRERQTQAWIEAGQPNLALVEHCGVRSERLPQIKLPGEPAWTIRASAWRIRAVVGGNPVKLGLREVARLCTFPDDYDFDGYGATVVGRVLGNAVPPEFAKLLLADY